MDPEPFAGPYGAAVRSALDRGHPHPEVLQHISCSLSYLCQAAHAAAKQAGLELSAPPEPLGSAWWSDLLALDHPPTPPEEEVDGEDEELNALLARARARNVPYDDEEEIRSLASLEIDVVV